MTEPIFTTPPLYEATAIAARSKAMQAHDPDTFCEKCNHVGLIFTEDLSEFAEGGWYRATACECANAAHLLALMRASGIPEAYHRADHMTWQNLGRTDAEREGNDDVRFSIQRIVNNIYDFRTDAVNLWLYGGVGTGKTYLACAVLRAALGNRMTARFTLASSMVRQSIHDREAFERLFDCDFIVIDGLEDLPETRSGYETSLLVDLLRYRIQNRLPLIFTSSNAPGQMPQEWVQQMHATILTSTLPLRLEGRQYERANDNVRKWA